MKRRDFLRNLSLGAGAVGLLSALPEHAGATPAKPRDLHATLQDASWLSMDGLPATHLDVWCPMGHGLLWHATIEGHGGETLVSNGRSGVMAEGGAGFSRLAWRGSSPMVITPHGWDAFDPDVVCGVGYGDQIVMLEPSVPRAEIMKARVRAMLDKARVDGTPVGAITVIMTRFHDTQRTDQRGCCLVVSALPLGIPDEVV